MYTKLSRIGLPWTWESINQPSLFILCSTCTLVWPD